MVVRPAAPGQRIILDTRDVDEARTRVANAYCGHTLTPSSSGHGFHAIHREALLGATAVHHLEYGEKPVEVDPVPLENWLLVSTPERGRLVVRSGKEERALAAGDTVVLDPYRKFHLRFGARCRLLTLRLDRTLVEQILGEMSGADHLPAEFGLGPPSSSKAARTWRSVSNLISSEAMTPGIAADHPLVRVQLERTLVAALAETHPLRARPRRASGSWCAPAAVRRAVAVIEDQPDRLLTLTDLAAAAKLSPRALQQAFRRHFDTTPMTYLREVRLRRAHEDLVAASPGDGTRVSDVAYRWGFGNLGRFARAYADRFDLLPSETLRR